MTHFGRRTSLRFTPLGEMRGTDLLLFAHRDAEPPKSSPTPQPWAPVNKHAGVGADGISALAPQTKLCYIRIRSRRLGRSTGKVGGGKGLGCRLVSLLLPVKNESWGQGRWKGRITAQVFPLLEQNEPTCHSTGTDSAVMVILLPSQCAVQGKCLLLDLELAVPSSIFSQGQRGISGPSGEPLVPPYLLTTSPMPLYILRSISAFILLFNCFANP